MQRVLGSREDRGQRKVALSWTLCSHYIRSFKASVELLEGRSNKLKLFFDGNLFRCIDTKWIIWYGIVKIHPFTLSLSSSSAYADWEEEAADPTARGRKGAEGEPGPQRGCGLRDPGELPAGGQPRGLRALCEDEVGAHYRAAQARG